MEAGKLEAGSWKLEVGNLRGGRLEAETDRGKLEAGSCGWRLKLEAGAWKLEVAVWVWLASALVGGQASCPKYKMLCEFTWR